MQISATWLSSTICSMLYHTTALGTVGSFKLVSKICWVFADGIWPNFHHWWTLGQFAIFSQ